MPRGSPKVSQGEHRGFSKNAFFIYLEVISTLHYSKNNSMWRPVPVHFCAFLTPESGKRDEDPESYVRERRKNCCSKKNLHSLMRIRDLFVPGSGIRNEKIRIRYIHPGSATLPAPHAVSSPTSNSNQLFTKIAAKFNFNNFPRRPDIKERLDSECLSRILFFSHPGSRISDPTTKKKRGEKFVVLQNCYFIFEQVLKKIWSNWQRIKGIIYTKTFH